MTNLISGFGGFHLIADTALRTELLMFIGLPAIFAIGWFGFFQQKQVHGTKNFVKYIALVVLLITAIMGFGKWQSLNDPIYKDYAGIGDGLTFLHTAAFFAPLALMALLGAWGWLHDKKQISDM